MPLQVCGVPGQQIFGTSYHASTTRTSCRTLHRNQQITSNNRACLTQITANHKQQKPTSLHASHRYQQITGNKSPALHASHRDQHITGNKLNCTSCHASHRYQQFTGNESCNLPRLAQIPANRRQQIVLLTTLHTDTSKSQTTKNVYCHASYKYQQITDNTNKSCFLPHRYQQIANHSCPIPFTDSKQIRGTKTHILPRITQISANHEQQTVHFIVFHTDKSYITNAVNLRSTIRQETLY